MSAIRKYALFLPPAPPFGAAPASGCNKRCTASSLFMNKGAISVPICSRSYLVNNGSYAIYIKKCLGTVSVHYLCTLPSIGPKTVAILTIWSPQIPVGSIFLRPLPAPLQMDVMGRESGYSLTFSGKKLVATLLHYPEKQYVLL